MKTNTLMLIAATIGIQLTGVSANAQQVTYHNIEIDDVDIFYREAGDPENPTVLLLHGFPTSSHMYRNLIPELADKYHVIAPDYPGFGNSEQPPMDEFEYSFDHLADIVEEFTEELDLDTYTMYVMDYGAPVGYRIAARNPEKVDALIVQNGNAYDEGLLEFWDPIKAYWADRNEETSVPLRAAVSPEFTEWQYTDGTRNPESISPDNWQIDLRHLERPGNPEIQLELFYSYRTNPPQYPEWQEYFREYQPPTLIVWGKNDYIFPAEGALAYRKDLPDAEIHLLNTGHFALEEDLEMIAFLIEEFLDRNLEP